MMMYICEYPLTVPPFTHSFLLIGRFVREPDWLCSCMLSNVNPVLGWSLRDPSSSSYSGYLKAVCLAEAEIDEVDLIFVHFSLSELISISTSLQCPDAAGFYAN